jgi:hypothetical protein
MAASRSSFVDGAGIGVCCGVGEREEEEVCDGVRCLMVRLAGDRSAEQDGEGSYTTVDQG